MRFHLFRNGLVGQWQVDSKVKAALTRQYNKEAHRMTFVKGKQADSMSGRSRGGGSNIGRSGEFEKEDVEADEVSAGATPVERMLVSVKVGVCQGSRLAIDQGHAPGMIDSG